MSAKTARQPNEHQRRFNQAMWDRKPASKPSPPPKGKLQPRDRETPRIGYERYVPMCLACGNPRGTTHGLKCADCR